MRLTERLGTWLNFAVSALFLSLIPAISGCGSMGSQTIRGDRFNYNEAGDESSKEQLLLNIVRLRYGEPIYFVEVTSMLSQFSVAANAAISGWKNDIHGAYGPALRAAYGLRGDPSRETTVSGNLHYSDTPTITYRPLQGEEFSKRVLAPIPPSIVIYLSHSGWSIDRLMFCCVQQINHIQNRQLQDTGTTPLPDNQEFVRVAELMKRLQDVGSATFSIVVENGVPITVLHIPATIPGLEKEVQELRQLLGYPLEGPLTLQVTANTARREPTELAMLTRSVLGAMYALSQECAVPEEHVKRHEVPEINDSGEPDSMAKWMQVKHSRVPQLDPFVQVFYNGHWYYIEKSDWSSKRTFALLTYLFSLQATDVIGGMPLVTIPTGR